MLVRAENIDAVKASSGVRITSMDACGFMEEILMDYYRLSCQDSIIVARNAMRSQQVKWTSAKNFMLIELTFTNISSLGFGANDVSRPRW
jgi:hypothetical protein